jgi:hypothetical protein
LQRYKRRDRVERIFKKFHLSKRKKEEKRGAFLKLRAILLKKSAQKREFFKNAGTLSKFTHQIIRKTKRIKQKAICKDILRIYPFL